ncbi:MAG: PBP1A family penicillin-binding protein [Candidatus Pacebacteria bacterium]|nr:PBP1A family penicillin-binding protein [Candidatus Paceibacterota bacterium]
MAIRKKYRAAKQSGTFGTRAKKVSKRPLRIGAPNFLSRRDGVYKKKRGIKWAFIGLFTLLFHFIFQDRKDNNKAKSTKKAKSNFFKKASSVLMRLAVISMIAGFFVAAGVFIYFSKDIPDPSKISDRSVDQSTKIYDRTGEHLLYEIHGEEKRTIVSLDQVSQHLIDATVATEDKKFYEHYGIDPKGIARAIYRDIISGEKAEGGSTITQQLIKNSVLTSEKKYTRKIKEIILALETEQKFSKEEILEMYLNQIPYGSNAYGIESAAQTFFGKSAKDLDIPEAAMLSALPQATTFYSPYGAHPEALQERYEYVISEMLEDGYISQEEADIAWETDILARVKPFATDITAPHFVMYIKQQLVDEYGEDFVEKGGLKVYTTLDYDMQVIAEDAVKVGAETNATKYNARNAALVAIDPTTGQILSMVGSKDYFNLEEDGNVNVAIASRQPGSSFKPFVYATALEKGYTPSTILYDVNTNFGADGSGKDFNPQNYNLQYSGPVTMRSALARSLNIPAVKTLYLAGINNSVNLATRLGISTLNNPSSYGLSLVLGTGEVKLLEMTGAYGVFANDGKKNELTGVIKIEDASGNILKEYSENSKQVIDTQVARNMSSILSDNAARAQTFGSSSKLYIPGYTVAAKTGTTNDYKDGWTMGYTPSIAVGVWAGNNDGEKMWQGGGITVAAPIWNDFMTRYLEGKAAESFIAPDPITTDKSVLNGKGTNEVVVVMDTACENKLAGENTPESQKEERTFSEMHNILYYVNKDDPQGDYPKNPGDDEQFANWEAGVVAWATGNATEGVNQEIPTEVCELRSDSNAPTIKVVSPTDNQIIQNGKFDVEVNVYSFFGVKQVEFYFDDELLKIDKDSPYEGSFRISSSAGDGVHKIIIKAYDKIENITQKEISIIVAGGETYAYLKPISGSDFPLVLEAVSSLNQEDIKKVEFYYQLNSVYDSDMNLIEKPGSTHKIGESTYPVPGSDNLYQFLWEEDKRYFISGKYKIYSIITTDKNKTYESNERYIEIK